MKKDKLVFICLLFLLGCGTSKKAKPAIDYTNPKYRLHDIWVAEAIEGQEVATMTGGKEQEPPRLEIFVEEMRVVGYDGCNELFGSIARVDEQKVHFTKIASTRKLCDNMLLADGFVNALKASDHYQIKNLRLHLFDAAGREVLRLRKVD